MKILYTFLLFFLIVSCNSLQKNRIEEYNNSYLKHNNKNFITLQNIDFSDTIFNSRELVHTSTPLVVKNVLYMGVKDYFLKMDISKGFVTYKKELPYSILSNLNLVDDDKLMFYASDGHIYLTDLSLKTVYWKYFLSDETLVGDVLVYKNSLIFKTSKDRLYALNKKNANLNWVTKSYLSDYMPLENSANLTLHEEKIYTGFSDGKVCIFDANSGRTLYEDSITSEDSFNDIPSSVMIHGELMYVPSYRNGMVAIDLKTKTKTWETGVSAISKLFVVDGIGYYFSSDALIKVALDTGKILAKNHLSVSNPVGYFLYHKKYILITSKDAGIYLINIDNLKESSKIKVSSGVSVKPILIKDKLIVLTNNSNLYVLKIK